MKRRSLRKALGVLLSVSLVAVSLAACGGTTGNSGDGSESGETAETEATETEEVTEVSTNLDKVDMAKWQYNSDDDVYYQIGISYCETPADEDYETMGFFVPGGYFDAEDNGDDTYTCTVNTENTVGSYTAETAPMVIPVETPGYSAMNPPTEYTDVTDYTKQGFVYVFAGCRGRDHGAPAGVTDLKAALRYTRYNADILPGDTEKIFSFGMSGGGAQSALIGATGNSELYTPYLEAIGAVSGISDAVAGSMCWCPITNLDTADEAYEWNMGVTRTDLSDEDQKLSNELADAFGAYINELKITDGDGNVLTLEESDEGQYQAGSYYDYIVGVAERSLNNFLSDTEFPYDTSSAQGEHPGMAEGGGPGGNGGFGGGKGGPGGGGKPDNIDRSNSGTAAVSLSGTYDTAEDYIAALNEPFEWVTYDASTNTATISSLADFEKAVKVYSKSLGAFDQLDASQGENTLFGYGDGEGAHFDPILADLVADTEYADAFAEDLAKEDSEGNTVDVRVDMYNPMYYLCDYYDGYQSSDVAKFWRIRTGCWQSDTSLSTETNLALAADHYSDETEVDYETVWGLGHTTAERTGTSTDNFIAWVNECAGK